jgi:hypothetical protein
LIIQLQERMGNIIIAGRMDHYNHTPKKYLMKCGQLFSVHSCTDLTTIQQAIITS